MKFKITWFFMVFSFVFDKRKILKSAITVLLFNLNINLYANEDVSIAPPVSMHEQVEYVPGDPDRPAKLVVTVLLPDGKGKFPVVIMNHGAAAGVTSRAERYKYTFSAYYFLSRGYAVILPMMRGFAGSEGNQDLYGCNQETVGIKNARDIKAVIEFFSSRSNLDMAKVVVGGQSFGGWNTLALGSLNLPNVSGLIDFAGGAEISSCKSTVGALRQAAGRYASKTNVPSIWFYGDNDHVFPPAISREMYDSYIKSGGQAELVSYGTFFTDAHNMLGYPEGLQIWAPKVDSFLKKIGLPYEVIHPEFLPTTPPSRSDYASIEDADAVPYLDEKGRETYRKFLNDSFPRVFVVGNGISAAFNGGFDPTARAMSACAKAGKSCWIYAYDDHVVWKSPYQSPPATHFSTIENTTAVPFLDNRGREGYAMFLRMHSPRAFVVSPDGGWSASSMGVNPISDALKQCSSKHAGCQPYAVDRSIVWSN